MNRCCQIANRDRISNLPDPILTHILSFLPMKDATRASVLSRQWEPLTHSLSNFEFVHRSHFNPSKFTNMVDAVLLRHDASSNIKTFCLKVVDLNNACMLSHHFTKCVSFAVDHNAQQIELWASVTTLPLPFFTCDTLTVLTMVGLENDWPSIVKFPALKSFTLDGVTFRDEEAINRIVSSSSCPVLEDLSIVYCQFPPTTTISISNSSVKYLKVYDMCDLPIKILITTLTVFQCICIRPSNLSFKSLSSLSCASVHFLENSDGPDVALDVEFNCATKLLKCLGGVEKLTLKSGIIEFISRGGDLRACLPAPSYNVKYLHIGMYPVKLHAQVIKLLLRSYPNVETMEIYVDDPQDMSASSKTVDMEEEWKLKETSHESILNCLTTGKVINFQGFEAEVEILRYLVENVKFLRNLNIHRWSSKIGTLTCAQEGAQITALLSFIARYFPGVATSVN